MESSIEGTVLAVSDDPGIADDLRFGLPGGLETIGASDAREAWKELGDSAIVPRAVVMDLQTGSAGGFSLASDLHQSERLKEVPIVMLIERDQDAWLADQAGARVVLRKPLEPAVLVDAVLSVLSEVSR
jgi:DNA-binding response OmpR family regulator